jgi:hypothetical protein
VEGVTLVGDTLLSVACESNLAQLQYTHRAA